MAVFDGVAGRRMSLTADNFPSISNAIVTIYGPDGAQMSSTFMWWGGVNFVEPQTLPFTGTYTVVVAGYSCYSGEMTLTVTDVPPDIAGQISNDGTPVNLPLLYAGQNARLTYNSPAWRHMALRVSDSTIGRADISILRDDGYAIGGARPITTNGAQLDLPLPTVDDSYTILINPALSDTGSMTLTLVDTPDATGAININGPQVHVNTFRPHQNVVLTFEGAVGQRVSLSGNTPGSSTSAYIYNPDGTALNGTYFTATGFIEPASLPVNGTYRVLIDPEFNHTFSANLSLHEVPPDVTGTLVIGDPPLNVTIPTPGQNARLTFQGTAGQRVKVKGNSQITGYGFVSGPDGSQIGEAIGLDGQFTSTLTLPATGTYAVHIDPRWLSTGSVSIQVELDTVSDVTATLEVGGPPVTVTTTVPEQNAVVTFEGIAGQRLRLSARDLQGIFYGALSVFKPDGSLLIPSIVLNEDHVLDINDLPVTGEYKILVDPAATYTGSVTLEAGTGNNIATNGRPVNEYVITPGLTALLTFAGASGQVLNFTFYDVTIPNCRFVVKAPNGTTLATRTVNQQNGFARIDNLFLPANGTYTITVEPGPAGTGQANVTIREGFGGGSF